MRKLLILALIPALVGAAGCGTANDKPAGKPAPQKTQSSLPVPAECERFRAALPKDWEQGFLEVPENPAEPGGLKIRVFYYGHVLPGSIPTLFFNGGPAHSSHRAYRRFAETQKIYDPDAKISFIYLDQRGTGCSTPYPKIKSKNDVAEALARTRFYGSEAIVFDAELVRKKLGLSQWNVFGQSYGSHIAHRYVMEAPGAIHAAFMHGHSLADDAAAHYRDRLRAQARVGRLYLQHYPDDRARIHFLKQELGPEKCFSGATLSRQKLCGYDVLVALELSYLGYPDQWARLHSTLILIAGNGKLSARALSQFVDRYYAYEAENDEEVTYPVEGVIAWTDRNSLVTWKQECAEAVRLSRGTAFDLNLAPFHECLYRLQEKSLFTDISPAREKLIRELPRRTMTLAGLRKTLSENPGLKFYLYSGELDIFSASETARAESKALSGLPHVRYTNFKNSGHEGFGTEAVLWQDLIQQSAKSTNQKGELR